jgi:hypothetical protein
VDESLGEADALEHALGVGAERTFATVLQADEFNEVLDAPFQLRAGKTAKFAVEAERFVAGEEAVEVGIFRKESDAAARFEAVGRLAKDPRFAFAGKGEAEEELERGAFAGTVGAEETEDFTGTDAKVEAVEGEEDFALPRERVALGQSYRLDGKRSFDRGSRIHPQFWMRGGLVANEICFREGAETEFDVKT